MAEWMRKLWLYVGTQNSSCFMSKQNKQHTWNQLRFVSPKLCALDCCHHFHYHPKHPCSFSHTKDALHFMVPDCWFTCLECDFDRLEHMRHIVITYTWQLTCYWTFSWSSLKESSFLFFYIVVNKSGRSADLRIGRMTKDICCSHFLFLSRFRGCYTLNTALLLTMKHTRLSYQPICYHIAKLVSK